VSVGDKLSARWKQLGLGCRVGLSDQLIATWEKNARALMPDDMRAYFRVVDGMDEGAMDPHSYLRFWQLAELKPAQGLPSTWLFADYSISALDYGINLDGSEKHGEVVALGGVRPHTIASSFGDFVKLYLDGSNALYGGPG